ncbi:MAG: RrF2 family transcriptional regulator [Candidatus Latescibacteria bacterium]|nr:RrF2 family transcriptional regulator [Candidatus Latescibacterota bacterium]
MKFSTKCEYGIRAAIDLALRYGQGYVQRTDIATRQRIPEPYLVQILATLRKGGYIRSVRGPKGGHALTRRPETITLGEMVCLLEGPITPTGCLDNATCELSEDCLLRDTWVEIKEAIERVLYSITLEDLCNKKRSRENVVMYHI